ncbi:MAG: hypothetical protein ACTHZ1_06235 [Sphingobacterium sp.]
MNQDLFKLTLDSITVESISNWMENPEQFIDVIPPFELDRLNGFLFDHLLDKDGGPTITNIRIDNFKFASQTNKGGFRLHFEINRRFCCSDTCATGVDYIDFQFLLENNQLIAEATYFDWTLNN